MTFIGSSVFRSWLSRISLLLLVSQLAMPFGIPVANAAPGVPKIISYQGRLLDSSGNLLGSSSGTTYYFKFSIWDNATVGSGSRLWPASAPTSVSATVTSGVFNVNIGDTANSYPTALDYNFEGSQDIFLQVEVSSDNSTFETLSPRQRLASSNFSLVADSVTGANRPSSFGTTTPIGLSQVTIEATTTTSVGLTVRAANGHLANIFQIQSNAGSNLFFANASGALFASSTLQVTGNSTFYGNVGVGTTSPGAAFSVNGGIITDGFLNVGNFTATGTTKLNGVTYTWPSSISAGNFLQTDVSGNLTWASTGSSAGGWTDAGTVVHLTGSTDHLAVGTTTPDVRSIMTIGATTTASTLLTLKLQTGATSDPFRITDSASTTLFSVDASGGLTATASSTFASGLTVSGAPLQASSTLLVGGLATFGSSGFISQGSSSASSFTAAGALTASSTLQVSGNSILYGTLGVGTTSPGSTLGIQGGLLVSGTSSVAGIMATGTILVQGGSGIDIASVNTRDLTIGTLMPSSSNTNAGTTTILSASGSDGASTPTAGGVAGGIVLQGGTGGAGGSADTGSSQGGAGSLIQLTAGAGGVGGSPASSGNGAAGGRGGSFVLTAGVGGAGGTGIATGGDGGSGGSFTLTAGRGGARGSNGNPTPGAGGGFTLTGGDGANAVGSTQGGASGGSFSFTGGTGGGGSSNTGGTGGSFTFTVGSGGTGSPLGTDGSFVVRGGPQGNAPYTFAIQDSAQSKLFFIKPGSGGVVIAATSTGLSVSTTTPDVRSVVTIGATSTTARLITLKLQTGQTGDPLVVTDSASSSIFTIDASGGFSAAASSSVAGTFQVSGGSLATLTGGFVGFASSSVASTFYVGNLSTLVQGFVSRASSTAAAAFSIGGTLSASSTLLARATTTLYSDLVFDNSVLNRTKFVVVPTTGESGGGSLRFATTTVDAPGQYPIITVTATTTGKLDYARVLIGTSTQTTAGALDQLFVAGRINSSWPTYRTDFLGNRAAATADAGSWWDNLRFDEDNAGGGGCSAGSFTNIGGSVYIETDVVASGEGCHLDMGDNNQFDAAHNPVLEIRMYDIDYTVNMTQWVGFANLAGGATTGTSTDGIWFYSHNGGTWQTVTRASSVDTGSVINTGISPSNSVYQTLRIEASSDQVLFYIDGKIVARHTTNIPTVVFEPDLRVENNAILDTGFILDYIKVWIDDPPGDASEGFLVENSGENSVDYDLYGSAITGEYMYATPEEVPSIPRGTVVSYDFNTETPRSRFAVKVSATPGDPALLGVTTNPESAAITSGRGDVLVAIGGRALVRASTAKGEIHEGDYLTSSDVPGLAVKSNGSGMVLGRALEDFAGADGETLIAEINPREVISTVLDDEPQTFGDSVLAAVADLGGQMTGLAGKLVRVTFEKVVAAVGVVGHLFTHDLTILPDGELTVPEGANQISGTAIIPQGVSSVAVQNTKVAGASKIFVTPSVATPYPLAVTAKDLGVGFTVSISGVAPFDIPFDWFIVSTYPSGSGSSQVNIPPPPNGNQPPPSIGGPAAPANLVAVPAGAGFTVGLSWVDTAANELGFKIERGSDGVNFSEVGGVGPDGTSFDDGQVTVGALYYYRVGAWHDGGISYSNIVQITVPGDGTSPPPGGNPPPPPPQAGGSEDTALLCADGLDNDGDTLVDAADPDCGLFISPVPPPPNPEPPPVSEDTDTLCTDSIDNDGDGLIDLADPDCAAFVPNPPPPPATEDTAALCADGVDNDADTLIDLADTDCASFAPPPPAPGLPPQP